MNNEMAPSNTLAASGHSSKPNYLIYLPVEQRQKWNIYQTYDLARTARGKLCEEAAKVDHDLRILIGRASMLDYLMIHLASAEQDQKRWFNPSFSSTRHDEDLEQGYFVTISEESEEEWEAEDHESSDVDSEYDHDEEVEENKL